MRARCLKEVERLGLLFSFEFFSPTARFQNAASRTSAVSAKACTCSMSPVQRRNLVMIVEDKCRYPFCKPAEELGFFSQHVELVEKHNTSFTETSVSNMD
jgi:hypothetical protein